MAPIGPFREPISPEVARQVAAVVPHVELTDLRLVSLAATLLAPPAVGETTDVDLDHHAEVGFTGNAVVIRVRYSLTAKQPSDHGGSAYLTLEATFQLTYVGENLNSLEKDKWTAFADVNAVHTSWPYLREIVQSVSARMGLDALVVPLLKMTRPSPITDAAPTT